LSKSEAAALLSRGWRLFFVNWRRFLDPDRPDTRVEVLVREAPAHALITSLPQSTALRIVAALAASGQGARDRLPCFSPGRDT
jgi:hypothetical protein